MTDANCHRSAASIVRLGCNCNVAVLSGGSRQVRALASPPAALGGPCWPSDRGQRCAKSAPETFCRPPSRVPCQPHLARVGPRRPVPIGGLARWAGSRPAAAVGAVRIERWTASRAERTRLPCGTFGRRSPARRASARWGRSPVLIRAVRQAALPSCFSRLGPGHIERGRHRARPATIRNRIVEDW